MPSFKKPDTLKNLCMQNLLKNIERYWLKVKEGTQLTKSVDDPESNFSKFVYILGPFEILDDFTIDFLLKNLYKTNQFNKNYLVLCLHNRLKYADLSFIKKKSFFNPLICNFIGNNCFNLTELNLYAQTEITPKNLCSILGSMKSLKKLNLAHTKANRSVTQLISSVSIKLENLNLENCKLIYDDCVEDICDGLGSTLQILNVDNIFLTDEIIEKVLITCVNLKFFYTSELLTKIASIYERNEHLDENQNEDKNLIKQYKFETFYIDSDIILKTEKMQALSYSCPSIRLLRVNCIGANESLSYLNSFSCLTELILSNNCSLISFKFGGCLLEALKNSIGKNLKSLDLIYLVDVNLRSIAKYCPNLVKLNVEFLGYYEPVLDKNLTDNETLSIQNLRSISISNTSAKCDQVHLNIGQFKKDLIQLLNNGQVKYLQLSCLNELDDEFFQCLLSTPIAKNLNTKIKHIYESIEVLELRQMNNVGPCLITDYLIDNLDNNLKQLNLIDCKQVGKGDYLKMSKLILKNNLDCNIKWS